MTPPGLVVQPARATGPASEAAGPAWRSGPSVPPGGGTKGLSSAAAVPTETSCPWNGGCGHQAYSAFSHLYLEVVGLFSSHFCPPCVSVWGRCPLCLSLVSCDGCLSPPCTGTTRRSGRAQQGDRQALALRDCVCNGLPVSSKASGLWRRRRWLCL